MNTYWVDPVGGNDANSGTSFAQAKATIGGVSGAFSLTSTGDTINLVNTGPLVTLPSEEIAINGYAGTSYTDFGLKIRGTDSSGSPAMAEIRFEDSVTSQDIAEVGAGSSYIIFEGLKVDWSVNATASLGKGFCKINNSTASNVRIQYNHFKQNATVGGVLLFFSGGGTVTSRQGEFRYNLIEDPRPSVSRVIFGPTNNNGTQGDFYNNVITTTLNAVGIVGILNCEGDDLDSTDHRMYNNTIVVYSAAATCDMMPWLSDDSAGPPTNATKHLHSNVLGWFSADNSRYARGGQTQGITGKYTRVIGWTLFSRPAANTWDFSGPYEVQWDPDDSDAPEGTSFWPTDVDTTQDVFNDKDTPFLWENINGSGYEIQLPGDYRIRNVDNWRTMSQSGEVPGALEDNPGIPDISVSPLALDFGIISKDTTQILEVTVSNVGDNDLEIGQSTISGDVANFSIESGGGPSTISPGGSQVIQIRFDPGGVESTFSGTLSIFALNDPDEDQIDVSLDGSSTAGSQYWIGSDSRPISTASPAYSFNPRTKKPGITAELLIQRNRELNWNLRVDGPQETITHPFTQQVEITTNTTQDPPILVGTKQLMMQTDADLLIQINSATFLLQAQGCVLIADANITTFRVTNSDTFRSARLTYYGAI